MRCTKLRLTTHPFDWRKLVFSHGWIFLSPFSWDDRSETMTRPFRLASGGNVAVSIRAKRSGETSVVSASVAATLTPADKAAIRAQLKRSLRLEDDFSDFHALCQSDPILWFVAEHRCGGLLRGATAFEDVIKTVTTTNCDWRNTKRMCEKLCALDGGNFPTPHQVLRYSERQLTERTSCGYRAKTFRIIAQRMLDGKLPLDDWAAQGDYDRLRQALKGIWGIGPYALSHILVLLGDYSTIPVDCEILRYLRNTHFDGRLVSSQQAVEPYERYGKFRYLAFKFGRMSRRDNYINK